MSDTAILRFVGKVERAGEISTLVINSNFYPALLGIESYSHLIILYWMHLKDDESNRCTLQVTPPRHDGAPLCGVFACRSPSRPNPIGLSVVTLEGIDGCKLYVSGLDALKGSPILDIKPYLPRSDSVQDSKTPEWMK